MDSESQLVARITEGDRDALAEFVLRHEPLIRARFRHQFEAGSLRMFDTSDFFSTVLRRVDSIMASRLETGSSPPGSLEATLNRVMMDALTDYRRASFAEQGCVVEQKPRKDRPAEQGERSGDLTSLEAIESLGAHLDPLEKLIVRLRSEGFLYRSIAATLGMSVSSVRMRWCRLSGRLRERAKAESA